MYSRMFKTTEQTYQKYNKASQIGTVRLDQDITPTVVEGLCTDGLSACICIVIRSEDGKKISLTHTDLMVDEAAIVKECKWIGKDCEIFLVKGIAYKDLDFEISSTINTKTLPRIQKAIQPHSDFSIKLRLDYFQAPSWAVAVTRIGDIKLLSNEHRIGQAAPDVEFRHTINMLNAYAFQLRGRYHSLVLQYDSCSWTEIPDLNPEAIVTLEGFKQGKKTPIPDLNANLRAYIEYANLYIDSKNKQAIARYKEGNYLEAIKLFKGVIGPAILCYGENHLSIASFCYNLGSAYMNTNELEKASVHLKKCLAIRIKLLEPGHEDIQKVQNRLNECTEQLTRQMAHT